MKKKAGKNWKGKSFQTSELIRAIAGKDNKRVLRRWMNKCTKRSRSLFEKNKDKRIPISDLTMKSVFMFPPQSRGDSAPIEKHFVTGPLHGVQFLPSPSLTLKKTTG